MVRSIRATATTQQQVDSVLLYLGKHGQQVGGLDLTRHTTTIVSLTELPPNVQLTSLQLTGFWLGREPGLLWCPGTAALKQLRLEHCSLGDGDLAAAHSDGGADLETWVGFCRDLESALSELPAGLEHLSILELSDGWGTLSYFPITVLQRLQHLTYLELNCELRGPPPLQALTRLVDLRLDSTHSYTTGDCITASMLSGTHHLTHLELRSCQIEAGILASKTRLQHLDLGRRMSHAAGSRGCDICGGAGVAQLLSHLQHMQQLTHFGLSGSLEVAEEGNPPAAAYAALTASSRLQHIDISSCWLPAGVWQHLFPAGRQLPHLQCLNIFWARQPDRSYHPAPDGSRLASCCPSLQSLDMSGLRCSAELLAPLQGLSGLHTLFLSDQDLTATEGVPALCRLAGLRDLCLYSSDPDRTVSSLLLPLTQLTHVTRLTCQGPSFFDRVKWTSQAPGDEPVWRQLLRSHLNHIDPEVAQYAAAALAE